MANAEEQNEQVPVEPVVMQEAAKEWTAAWRVIVTALKELKCPEVDHNARAIIARLSQAGMLIVFSDSLKD